MKITSVTNNVIETKMNIYDFEKKFNNSENYIMLFDVWINGAYTESIQIEKKRIKEYG